MYKKGRQNLKSDFPPWFTIITYRKERFENWICLQFYFSLSPVCVCFLSNGRTCAPPLGAALQSKLSPEFLWFVAHRKGKICLRATPLALVPHWAQLPCRQIYQQKNLLLISTELCLNGSCFCFAKKQIKKRKRQENKFQFLVWLNAEDTSPLCPWLCVGSLWALQKLTSLES